MSEYLTALDESLSAALPYALNIVGAMWEAASAAARRPSFAWVAAAFLLGLWLPRKPWEAPGKTWAGAGAMAVVGFVVAAAIGALLVGGV